MLDVVTQWVAHYGFALVALFLLIEAAGVPVPGETALVTAAALAGRGGLSIAGVVLAGIAGTIVGGHIGYWIGERGGHPFVARYGRWFGLTAERLDRTHRFFQLHGAKTVLVGRFIAVVRSFVGIFAGLSSMSKRVFALYNAIGGAVWVVAFSFLGYVFGRNLPRLVHYIGRVSLLVALLIALVAAVFFLWRWFARNRAAVVAQIDESFQHAAQSRRMSQMREQHPKAWRFLTGRFAQGEYMALHLAVGFVVALAAIAIFASITEGLLDSSPLTRFDVAVADQLHQSVSPSLLDLFDFLSSLGGRGAMTMLLLAGAVVYGVRRRWVELSGWIAAFVGGTLLDLALRAAVRRSELPFADIVLLDWKFGLVSGHVLGVLVGYGMLGYAVYAALRSPGWRTLDIAVVAIVVAAITVARLYLEQAYISDATAGLAAGLIWVTTCISAIEVARQRRWET